MGDLEQQAESLAEQFYLRGVVKEDAGNHLEAFRDFRKACEISDAEKYREAINRLADFLTTQQGGCY